MDSSGGLQVLVDAPRTVALSEELHALAPREAAERLRDESDAIAARALALVNPAEAADILGQLSPERRDRIIAAAPDGRGEQWRVDLQYDESSVGRLMERPLGVFRPETTVASRRRATARARAARVHHVRLRDGLERPPRRRPRVPGAALRRGPTSGSTRSCSAIRSRCSPETPLVDAMRTVVTRHYPAYPVCDAAGRLVGMVRGQALFERQAFEISAQAGSMVGVEKEERVGTPWLRSFKFRHPWLQLNLLTAFLAAAVVGVVPGHDRPHRGPGRVPAGARRTVGQHRLPGARGHPARHHARRPAQRSRRGGSSSRRRGSG